jgi:hypothetical protein
MDSLAFLDLAAGLVFIYFILSITSSAILEFISELFNLRGRLLKGWFVGNFNSDLYNKFTSSLTRASKKLPHKIPAGLFTEILWEISMKPEMIQDFPEEIRSLWGQNAAASIADGRNIRIKIKKWFSLQQGQVTRRYKIMVRWCLVLIAAAIIIPSNCDTFRIAGWLYSHENERIFVAGLADNTPEMDPAKLSTEEIKNLQNIHEELIRTGMPIGWDTEGKIAGTAGWMAKSAGLLITVLCVSMGAPFWYDLLRYITRLRKRTTGKAST